MAKKAVDQDSKATHFERTSENDFIVEHDDGSRFECTTEECSPEGREKFFSDMKRKTRGRSRGTGKLFGGLGGILKNGKVVRNKDGQKKAPTKAQAL